MNAIQQIRDLCKRLAEAERLAEEGKVAPVEGVKGMWLVEGCKGTYMVDLTPPDSPGCECRDAKFRPHIRGWCKHRLAVEVTRMGGNGDRTGTSRPSHSVRAELDRSSREDNG